MPEVLHWQRSSYSAGGGDTNCLETATAPTTPPPPRERRPRHNPLAHPHRPAHGSEVADPVHPAYRLSSSRPGGEAVQP
ncbi:DUF397 domain-containing protein [Streptomyces bobili]|uniref:DUF397 domain-containing protein n=1 Tax=Streptomyces bobili TaxID=67280 RepID=UPI0033DA87CC